MITLLILFALVNIITTISIIGKNDVCNYEQLHEIGSLNRQIIVTDGINTIVIFFSAMIAISVNKKMSYSLQKYFKDNLAIEISKT